MNIIKKIAVLSLFFLLFISCSTDNEETKYHFEFLKIETIVMPDTFILGETYEIKMTYFRPTNCHSFSGFYYDKNLNVRTIAVQNIVTEVPNCLPLIEEIEEVSLNFYVTNNGSYIFKFWQGTDANGDDIFLEKEVPVED